MVSLPCFNEKFSVWMKRIDANAECVINNPKNEYSALYNRALQSFIIFSPLIEQLPKDQSTWATGRELDRPRETDVHFAFESLIQGIFLSSCNLWSPANHSARCALEQMFITIHSIGYPVDFKIKDDEHDKWENNGRISDKIDTIFEIPLFINFSKLYKTKMGENVQQKKIDKTKAVTFQGYIKNNYHHLSYYVHTSNLQIGMQGVTPHLTEDLSFNDRYYKETIMNLNESLDILVSLLFITNYKLITQDHVDQLKNVTDTLLYDVLLAFWTSIQGRKP